MRIVVLYTRDFVDGPGAKACEDTARVAVEVAEGLRGDEAEAELLPVAGDPRAAFATLVDRPPDAVFNLWDTTGGDGRGEMAVAGLLDCMGLPYTGSGVLALGLADNKHLLKRLLVAHRVPTPRFATVTAPDEDACAAVASLRFPLIVKAACEHASIGIDFASVVEHTGDLQRAVARVLEEQRQPAIVEQYIDGREISVSILGNRPPAVLPPSEIRFGPAFDGHPRIVSYDAKWEPGSPQYTDSPAVSADLEPAAKRAVEHAALGAFASVGCRDYGRVDLRVTADGHPYVIDVNPNCDLGRDAGLARAAMTAGIGYRDLLARLVALALERALEPSSGREAYAGNPRP